MISRLLHIRLFGLSLGLIILAALAAQGQTVSFTSFPYGATETTASARVDVVYIYNAGARASDGSEVRYSLRFGPTGMKVDSRTGVVSWLPTAEGDVDAEIRAELVDNPSVNTTQGWKITAAKTDGHPGCTGNDVWLPVERGLPGPGEGATVMNGDLYVTHKTKPADQPSTYQLSKWNGAYWQTLSDMDFGGDSLGQIIGYKNEIYMTTPQDGIPGVPNSNYIARWDGTKWTSVGLPDFDRVFDMEVVGGELYVLAYDSWQTLNTILEKWDGTSWTVVDRTQGQWGVALAALNDRLYVAGPPKSFGLEWNQLPLLQLNNGKLEPVPNNGILIFNDYPTLDLVPYNGTLVLITVSPIFQWDGTETKQLPSMPSHTYAPMRKGISFKGELYGLSEIEPGVEGMPNAYGYSLWRLADNQWHPVSEIGVLQSQFAWPNSIGFIEYDNRLYTYGHFGQSCGISLNHVAVLGTEAECAHVSGTVFHDYDRNCTVDPNEPGLENEFIEIQPGPSYITTDKTGAFSALLLPGTYSFQVSPKLHWVGSCPNPPQITLASPAAAVDNVDIGVDMIPGIYDIRTSLAVGPARPGFDVVYTFTWFNIGSEPATGKAMLEYDNQLVYKSATTNPSRQNGNRLEWDFTNLPAGQSISVTITLNIPVSVPLDIALCAFADVELENKGDDFFLGDNIDSICTAVRSSYDPNNIEVAPVRQDPEFGEAPLLPGDTVLNYLVRFQNTGNDTAFTVIVADTLDASLLDITSIQLGAASNDFDFKISGRGILTWTFNKIMLPDSNVNEPASHGYFKYSIHLKRGLAPLTQIPNHASIYFDYNEPVLTNSVVSITSGTLSVSEEEAGVSSLQIYPNPVRGRSIIQVNLSEKAHVKLQLVDSRGEVVQVLADREMNSGEETMTFNSERLASGAYYLILDQDGSKEIYPIVIGR